VVYVTSQLSIRTPHRQNKGELLGIKVRRTHDTNLVTFLKPCGSRPKANDITNKLYGGKKAVQIIIEGIEELYCWIN